MDLRRSLWIGAALAMWTQASACALGQVDAGDRDWGTGGRVEVWRVVDPDETLFTDAHEEPSWQRALARARVTEVAAADRADRGRAQARARGAVDQARGELARCYARATRHEGVDEDVRLAIDLLVGADGSLRGDLRASTVDLGRAGEACVLAALAGARPTAPAPTTSVTARLRIDLFIQPPRAVSVEVLAPLPVEGKVVAARTPSR